LLPISDGYTNVTLTRSQVLSPQLPELISPEEHAQIKEHAEQTRQTLAALDATIQRKSAINQQPYVDLRALSDIMSTEGNNPTPTAWLYAVSILSIILSGTILVTRYRPRPIPIMVQKCFPSRIERPPCLAQVTSDQSTPGSVTVGSQRRILLLRCGWTQNG
jgi:hypothetical protein